MINIEMHGLKRTQEMLVELPRNTEIEMDKASDEFLKIVQKTAVLLAPKFTGALASSINFTQKSKLRWELTVDSPYGWFQEHGWNPNWLPSDMPTRTGLTIGDWMSARGLKGRGIRPTGLPHPFIQPALETGLEFLPTILEEKIYNAAKRSKK